jgi:hypothetical protein
MQNGSSFDESKLEPIDTFATAELSGCTERISPQVHGLTWSGRVDLNHRPPGPEPGALTGLRHAPQTSRYRRAAPRDHGAPGGTRIPNLLIRSQMLYPIELQAPVKIYFLVTTADMSRLRRHIRRIQRKLAGLRRRVKQIHDALSLFCVNPPSPASSHRARAASARRAPSERS